MAYSVRSRRVSIAAGLLSVALVAPAITVPASPFAAVAVAQTVVANGPDDFGPRYDSRNFWGVMSVPVIGIKLNPGDGLKTRFSFGQNTNNTWSATVDDDGNITLTRPTSDFFFNQIKRDGEADVPVTITRGDGTTYDATLKVKVVDEKPKTPEQVAAEEAAAAQKALFDKRYDTENFWNKQTVAVPGLKLNPGDQITATSGVSLNRWGVAADKDGNVTVSRPQTGYGTGNKDISVRVTTAAGVEYTATLQLNVIDQREAKEWEKQLNTRYTLDFEKSTSAKNIEGLTLPEDVTLNKASTASPTGWEVKNDGTTVRVAPPSTFKEGDFDLPVTVKDGTETFSTTLKIAAKNPERTAAETAGTVAGILGPILGTIIGGATGGGALGSLGNIIGGLFGGGTGGTGGTGGGEGGTGGGGTGGGRLINVVITGNANPSNIGNNNGSPNVIITDNVNPRDNLSNNGNPSVVITDNANPNVEIKDNLANNGNPVVTGNANPIITGNANPNVEIKDNLANNGNPVVTGNANPIITGNANPNVEIKDNVNPTVVVTGNANPNVEVKDNINPTVVVTGNANPNVEVKDNINPIVTGNANPDIEIKDNINPTVVVTGNANPNVEIKDNVKDNAKLGAGGSSSKSKKDEEDAGEEKPKDNLQDPRCIASLVSLGIPLASLIPLALTQLTHIPALQAQAEQAGRAFDNAARQLGMRPQDLAAIGGGAAGAVLALISAAAAVTCSPKAVETTEATVVKTTETV